MRVSGRGGQGRERSDEPPACSETINIRLRSFGASMLKFPDKMAHSPGREFQLFWLFSVLCNRTFNSEEVVKAEQTEAI